MRNCDAPVIPKRRTTGSPFEPNLYIDITLIHTIQVIENRIAFTFIQSNDTDRHRAVDEERFPARSWMYSHDWVSAFNVLGTGSWVFTIEVLVSTSEDGIFSIDDFAEVGGEFLVGCVAGSPERVASDFGNGVVVEVGDSRWLSFVDEVL